MSEDPIKDVLQLMPYGFYSLTSRNKDDVNAMVANWITQASFEPRLLVICLQKSSYTHKVIEDGGVFAINIFKKENQDRMMPFTKGRSKRPDKMNEARYSEAPETGCPILEGASAYIECKLVRMIDIGGDHDIVVGRAIGAGVLEEISIGEALTLPDLGWSYAG